MGNWASSAVQLDPIEFDGDIIYVTVNRLRMPAMSKLSGKMADGKLVFSSQIELCITAAEIIPEYLTELRGMKKSDGSEFTKDEFVSVINEFYFAPFVSKILNGLILVSSIKAEEAKN